MHVESHEVEDKLTKRNDLIIEDVSIENLMGDDTEDLDTPSLEEKENLIQVSNFKCSNCATEFTCQVDLKLHEENVHKGNNVTSINSLNISTHNQKETKSIEVLEVSGGVICSFCKLQSKNHDTLKKHIINVHNIGAHTNIKHTHENITMVNSESCTKCLKCPFIRSKNEMKEHKETKHKMNFTCQD